MNNINQKLRFHYLLLIGCATCLFFSGMIRPLEVYAQKSLLDSTSVKINGENWTFRTPPPPVSQRQVISSHPRLFITQANLPELRTKLSDTVYAKDMTRIRKSASAGYGLENALLYVLEGNVSQGTIVKNWLLAGSFDFGNSKWRKWVEPILAFDWIMPLLSNTEKHQIFELLKANFSYDPLTDPPPLKGETRYWNDAWSRKPEVFYPILALAIAGDGIDDVWAQEILDLTYNESPNLIGPYGATKGGGFLDILASLSLDDGGGAQVDSAERLGLGYHSMFLHTFVPMGTWETATGQAMWARSSYFQKMPFFFSYERSRVGAGMAPIIFEMLTGIYRNIDPDAAALARWHLNQWGRSPYNLAYRLILGDLRVAAKSPEELGLATAKYIRGADLFVSSRSWDENAVTLTAISRYSDTGRYEPASGTFAIHRGQEPLAVPAEPAKGHKGPGLYSGLWFYDPNDVPGTIFQKSSYWNYRVFNAYEAASKPSAFPGGPDNLVINNTYRGISTEYSKGLKAPGVRTARQTIVHIIDTNRDYIVVYNYTDVPPNIKRAWSMRLATPPNIQINGYSIPGMTATVIAPNNHTISWVGGVGDEMKSPPPEKVWYTKGKAGDKPGYSSDPNKAKRWGMGNLFVQPASNAPEKLEFLVVMQVSDQAPIAVNRISDREAKFGGWQVSFSSDGKFNVTPPNGTNIDTIPPASPTSLHIQ